ncbi:putative short-chain dehydrogenase/reductase family 42E member 2 isoform X1 [Macaca thibetana thibetana]|uniref:putative short-chain dehydrogenase/reductase family 42E member 2 isoform X1 n=1 Tax=Macaca thibetana thibetana TaxID=257877 RepID=UPI0021BC4DA9|nr:putative short-chain dehydrogenase/reductase family 42E member 2 isoform X1 [Macaca thibetana thibetana]
MKSNPPGSSPEACKAAGQGEKSCPVCQACGEVSGPRSGLGSESGPAPKPGAIPGPGLGPKAIPGPQAGSGVAPRPGAISGTGPGLGPGPVARSVPGPGAESIPGLGAGSVPGPGTGSIPGLGVGSIPGPGAGSVLGPGAGSGPGLGAGSAPGPGSGSVPGLGAGLGHGLGAGPEAGSVPGPGAGSVPGPGAGSTPEPELGPGPRQGSGTGPKPKESTTTPTPAPQQKTQAKPTKVARQKVLVTGGGGYLGFSLGSHLAKSGTPVILLDRRRPQWELSPETEFIQADVRDEEALYRAFKGVDCVFHMASYGLSGAEKLQKEQIESINVGGTKLVIDVCVRQRVPRLIYTSTVNVAFGGKPIEQGDEDSVPYFPLDEHIDHYSRTKAIADQLTLMANGTPLPGGGALRTCVLRPPGIYGPEEQRHLPRVAGHIKKRLFMFRFGDRKARMNWVHVHNLVQAHVLAAEALTTAKGYVASGQAYYINDGESVNLFEWMAPLFEKLGYSQPWIQVPTSWVYLTAAVMEHLHLALRPICCLPPLLTRSEVRSVAVTHTFQIAKARAQLGYAPDKFKFADAVELYVQSTTRRPRGSTARTLLRLLLGLLLFLGLLALALHFLGLQPLHSSVERL